MNIYPKKHRRQLLADDAYCKIVIYTAIRFAGLSSSIYSAADDRNAERFFATRSIRATKRLSIVTRIFWVPYSGIAGIITVI